MQQEENFQRFSVKLKRIDQTLFTLFLALRKGYASSQPNRSYVKFQYFIFIIFSRTTDENHSNEHIKLAGMISK